MRTAEIFRAWGMILKGTQPCSFRRNHQCAQRCPGCYAYESFHLGGMTLRELRDRTGDELVRGVPAVADRFKPLDLSLVGGDPLVRHREVETLIPLLIARGIHVQVVTSAFRPIPRA